ncbi:MAG: purine-nucleoside phosphorylase [Desulfovibrionaceae bacterium]|nr:purine-nucleoside phosphorylase [Desulfovibrionaceae bacterium]
MPNGKKVQNCAAAVRSLLPADFAPKVGMVLGTGLGGVSEKLEAPFRIPYADLPDYPLSTVASHAGRFSAGRLSGMPVIMQEGRCHLYEGRSPQEVVMGVRVMAELGVEVLIVTNAAGGLNPLFAAGDIMLLADQINFTGRSPLTGLEDACGRSRFVDMSAPFDAELSALAVQGAVKAGFFLRQGVFLGLAGPQMESRAETRMFRAWGADAVSMSTVLEVIAARHLGLRVLGLSVISNLNLPDNMADASLEEVIKVSSRAVDRISRLIESVLEGL